MKIKESTLQATLNKDGTQDDDKSGISNYWST